MTDQAAEPREPSRGSMGLDELAAIFAEHDAMVCCDPKTTDHIWRTIRLAARLPVDKERGTHGRHCPCSACAREDWTNLELAACGRHGPSCPHEYAPMRFPVADAEGYVGAIGLRRAVEDSMQDIGLGSDERLDRAAARIAGVVTANIESVKLSEDSLPGDGFDSWADGFRQGWQAAREAAVR